ncbi:MAG: VIT1/CCC1 transporter family protein [Nanoarchaeota archaeon]|nr:VIT1/CCC1 transporter family protein [Nanoarchaeota archaeon]
MASRIKKAQRAFESRNVKQAKQAHSRKYIQEHMSEESSGMVNAQYLGEFVYGAVDGAVTTFAVVAGSAGAALSPGIVIILGFANLIADGFSMASGNFLSERTQREYIEKERKREEWETENVPEGEKEEIREIFRKKGFKGKDLERAVEIITSDKKVWVDTMMADELGLIKSPKTPWKTAASTYFGFIMIGIIPLLAYVLAYFHPFFGQNTFMLAVVMTGIALAVIGVIKRYVTKKNLWKSVFETVFIGGAAAFIAYCVGFFLRWIVVL